MRVEYLELIFVNCDNSYLFVLEFISFGRCHAKNSTHWRRSCTVICNRAEIVACTVVLVVMISGSAGALGQWGYADLIFLSFGSFKEKINSNKNASRPCTQGS
jgi:hypothetical protein